MSEESDRLQQPLDVIGIATLDLLDHRGIDWSRVERTAYLVHQHLRYEYPGPIHDLNHRLMIVPPERYGDQRRVVYRVEVSVDDSVTTPVSDEFGNVILEIAVPQVPRTIDFEAWIVVERSPEGGPVRLPADWLTDRRMCLPSRLTMPDEHLSALARQLQAAGARGLELADRINSYVYNAITYTHDATDVHTTAAAALAAGRGVCQDYAHVMLTLCRLCGLPARYVSGHLLGEGGTHAWVEVLCPDEGDPTRAVAYPFDPTHNRRASLSYLTIAVGRDYRDVAPTSGTYRASYSGHLSAHKSVGLTAIDYGPGDD